MAKPKRRSDGSGSVYQRADGTWVAQVRVYDELQRKSVKYRRYASSREGARNELAQLRKAPKPAHRSSGSMTLAQYLRWWLDFSLPMTGISDSTKEIYRQTLTDYAIPAAGRLPLADMRAAQAEQWIAQIAATRKFRLTGGRDPHTGKLTRVRAGDPIAASTVRNTYNAAVKALDTAVRDDVIPANPLRMIPRPKSPRPPVPVTRPEDVDRLLAACQGRAIAPLVYFVAFTGCRIGEALSLRWSDVDLDRATATIRRGTLNAVTTKNGRVRTVTLLPEVTEQLILARSSQARNQMLIGQGWANDRDLVFTTTTGHPVNRHNAARDLSAILLREGIDPARPWHSLRHGLAHRLLTRGLPLPVVSAILGHSGIQITADTYGHVEAAVPRDVLAEAFRSRRGTAY